MCRVLKSGEDGVQSSERIQGKCAEFWNNPWRQCRVLKSLCGKWLNTTRTKLWNISCEWCRDLNLYLEMCRDLKWILGVGRSIERACLILKVGSSWSLQIAWVWLCAEFWNDFVVVCRVLKWFQRDVQSSELSKSYKWLKIGSVQRNEKNLWACTEFWNLLACVG